MTRIIRQLEYFKLQLKYLENITHYRLNLKTLDVLVHVSLCGLEVCAIVNIWRNMRDYEPKVMAHI